MSRRTLSAVAVAMAVGALLSACGGETASDVYGEIDPAGSDAGELAGISTDGGADVAAGAFAELGANESGSEISVDARRALTDFYWVYLLNADLTSIGQDRSVESYASADVIKQFESEAKENQARLDSDLEFGDLLKSSAPEIISIEGAVHDAVLTSCNEVVAERQSDFQATYYQTERVRIKSVDGDWVVTERELVHDGSFFSPTLGCVPTVFGERSEVVIEDFLEGYYASYRTPGNPDETAIGILKVELADELREELASFASQGLFVDFPVEQTLEVIGSDNKLSGRTFVVNVCSTYPEGIGTKDASSGDWVGDVNFVGDSLSVDYRVNFSPPGFDGDDDGRILERSQPILVDSCDRG